MNTYSVKKLDFMLQDFVRTTWVSDHAMNVWKPRINKIMNSWIDIACINAAKTKQCSLQLIKPIKYFQLEIDLPEKNLSIDVLEIRGLSQGFHAILPTQIIQGKPFRYLVAIGPKNIIFPLKDAWKKHDWETIDQLTFQPACCKTFWNQQNLDTPFYDSTWQMALNTLKKNIKNQNNNKESLCEIQGHPYSNALLRWLGIQLVYHAPCSFNCDATNKQVSEMITIGRNSGYSTEMDWLEDILSWPIEWSSLHGIAEIKTPVVKFSATTDATADKYIVQYKGNAYPEEGATGTSFPYKLK